MKFCKQFGVLAACVMTAEAMALQVNVRNSSGEPVESAVVAVYGDLPQRQMETAVMDQHDRQFLPQVLAVQVGTKVTFPNSDDIRHHVYSFSPAKRFELRLYHGTTAEPVMFDQPGKVVLGCNIHDSMLGYIYVLDTPAFAVTDVNGRAQLDVPPGRYRLQVQHPRADQLTEQAVAVGADEPGSVQVEFGRLAPDPRSVGEKTELEALFD